MTNYRCRRISFVGRDVSWTTKLLPPPLIHRGRAAGGQTLWGCINHLAMDHAVLCSPNVFSALAYVPNVPLLHMTLAALGHYVAAPAWMYHAAAVTPSTFLSV